ncbi:MAG: D-tyrosyl-tRNA(Tyr) deacylase [Ruminococcaceae bacterium]|nr:D-tyrosyl-tRNA(Tyr) deacylase [Oscillospiraceae bacterium]
MIAVIQRVSRASVKVEEKIEGACEKGFLVLLGVKKGDTREDADLLADKICGLRIFTDENDKMNLALSDVGGTILAISNFTLLADASHGRRPNFMNAELPIQADELYRHFVRACRIKGIHTETGVFGAHMEVELLNDGPVTILLDSEKLRKKG